MCPHSRGQTQLCSGGRLPTGSYTYLDWSHEASLGLNTELLSEIKAGGLAETSWLSKAAEIFRSTTVGVE